MVNNRTTIILSVIIFTSIVISLIIWRNDPFSYEPKDDSLQYHLLARNLVEHGTLSLSTEPPYIPSARRTPGYSIFLAPIYYFFGPDLHVVKLIQIAFIPMICLLIYFLCRLTFENERFALVVVGFVAISPHLLTFVNCLLTESLFILVLVAATCSVYMWMKKSHVKWAICSGILWGAMALIKPESALLLVAVLPVAFINATNKSKFVSQSLLSILITIVIVAPWVCRTYHISNKINLISGQRYLDDGPGLLRSYRLRAEHGLLFNPRRFKYLYGENWREANKRFKSVMNEKVVNPKESDSIYFLKHPTMLLKYGVVKFIGLCRPVSLSGVFGITGDFSYLKSEGKYIQFSMKALLLLFDALVFLTGATGLLLSMRWKYRQLWIISITIVYFLCVYTMIHGIPRYRVIFTPLLILLGIWSMKYFWIRWIYKGEKNETNSSNTLL